MNNEKETASSSPKPVTKHRNRYDPLRDQFYTCDELAEMLGVKSDTIAGHARSGRLPACQPFPQGVWLFPKDELAAYLRKRVNVGPGPFIRPLRARSR